jgi:hypothetical protein
VVLRPLAGLEVQLGSADLVDQNKMQAQGSAWQPQRHMAFISASSTLSQNDKKLRQSIRVSGTKARIDHQGFCDICTISSGSTTQ